MKMTLVRTLIILSLIGSEVLGYPPQGRLMPDGAQVPADAVEHEDSVASASNVDEEYDDGDDSDIYMEADATDHGDKDEEKERKPIESQEKAPDDAAAEAIENKEKPAVTSSAKTPSDQNAENTANAGRTDESDTENNFRPKSFYGFYNRNFGAYRKMADATDHEDKDEEKERKPIESQEKAPDDAAAEAIENKEKPAVTSTAKTPSDQNAENTANAGRTDESDSENKSLETESQNFFPSFAELFANHRQSFNEQHYRPNRFLSYFARDRGAYQQREMAAATTKDVQHPLLGSGNFGVIRGGTYYPEEKENDEYSADDSGYNPYYRGRANYYRNPKPQPIRGGDFFANFRDFADITAPPKSSFSHLSVVYANKNGSATGRISEPRNIIETLKMLEEEAQTNAEATTTTEVPRKKLSKGKRKLTKMKQYEEDKARRSRMSVEPLLALS